MYAFYHRNLLTRAFFATVSSNTSIKQKKLKLNKTEGGGVIKWINCQGVHLWKSRRKLGNIRGFPESGKVKEIGEFFWRSQINNCKIFM